MGRKQSYIKYVNGKMLKYNYSTDTKAGAKKHAKLLRGKGYRARVFKGTGRYKGKYVVFSSI